MSVDLFVYRNNSPITSDELRKACKSISLRFPGVVVDTSWDATDDAAFPHSEAFFWHAHRASVELATPPNAEVFEVQGQNNGDFAYAHLCTNASLYVFSDFLAHALATEMNAEVFDPQEGSVIPVSLPSLDTLKERHDEDIANFAPILKKEYRWILQGDQSTSPDEGFESNAKKFNNDLTCSMRATFDRSFSGLNVTRNTFTDLTEGLHLFASFSDNTRVIVQLTGDTPQSDLFDHFANDLAVRFGKDFQSRLKYVFPSRR